MAMFNHVPILMQRRWLGPAAAAVIVLALGTIGTRLMTAPSQQATVQQWEARGASRLTLASRDGQAFGTLLVRADGQVAHLAWVARPRDETADARPIGRRGLLGAIARTVATFGTSDRCLVSEADDHALSAPESLALLLLVKELTDTGS